MSKQLRFIVDALNKAPYNKRFNLISFDSLDSLSLLQVLNDVLSEVSPDHKIDLREELPEQTAIRMLNLLRVLKYKPKTEDSGGSSFRHSLIQADKGVIYPLLHWLLERMPELKKRAYLACFLMKVEVPPEHLQEEQVSEMYAVYQDLVEQFKDVHKTVEHQRSSKFNVAEIRKDIASMEEEKEQLRKRIERLKNRSASAPNHEEMLSAARSLRMERDREIELSQHRVEENNRFLKSQQKQQRLSSQLKEQKSNNVSMTPELLLTQLKEDNQAKCVLAQETVAKKIEVKRRECIELEKVISEGVTSELDLQTTQEQIDEVNAEISRLREKHMPGADPVQNKLALFRQQASIIANKKETTAEEYKSALDELAACEEELKSKLDQLKDFDGKEVLQDDEFKRYVGRLRTLNTTYKQKKAELFGLKAEYGVLARTEEILKSRAENLQELVALLEQKKGVHGYREAQEDLEQVSAAKGEVDQEKAQLLQEMSNMADQLVSAIAKKKASLAPLIKELRPLRQQHQELTATHTERKMAYDVMFAGLESNRARLEQEVRAYWEECTSEESQYHLLQCQMQSLGLHRQRVAAEMKTYVSSNAAEKKKSLRDQFTQKIQEQEKLGKALRDKQKAVRESHGSSVKQVKMWKDLKWLLQVKHECHQQSLQQQRHTAENQQAMMAKGEERLVLT